MRARARSAVLAVVAAAAGACTSARPAPCPGEPIATLPLQATIVAREGGCAFVYGTDKSIYGDGSTTGTLGAAGLRSSFNFTATVALAGDGTALLCPERAEASPLRGTLQADHLVVAGLDPVTGNPTVPANVPTAVCACSLQVSETLEGTLVRSDTGSVAFDGTLRDVLTVADQVDPATCEPTPTASQPGPRCGAPCELHWTVSGAR